MSFHEWLKAQRNGFRDASIHENMMKRRPKELQNEKFTYPVEASTLQLEKRRKQAPIFGVEKMFVTVVSHIEQTLKALQELLVASW